jgi:hypothetical protein
MVTTNPTSPQVLEAYTLLQIAAESFLNGTDRLDPAKPPTGSDPFLLTPDMLTNGNLHSSRMTLAQATKFKGEWKVICISGVCISGVTSAGSGLAFCPPVT